MGITFNNEGVALIPIEPYKADNFIYPYEEEMKLKKKLAEQKVQDKIKWDALREKYKYANNNGMPYEDSDMLIILEEVGDTIVIEVFDRLACRFGRTPDALKWIFRYKRALIKEEKFIEERDDAFTEQIKRCMRKLLMID